MDELEKLLARVKMNSYWEDLPKEPKRRRIPEHSLLTKIRKKYELTPDEYEQLRRLLQ